MPRHPEKEIWSHRKSDALKPPAPKKPEQGKTIKDPHALKGWG